MKDHPYEVHYRWPHKGSDWVWSAAHPTKEEARTEIKEAKSMGSQPPRTQFIIVNNPLGYRPVQIEQ